VSLSILITYFWAFWGIVENSHEGWYCESLLSNLGLMFAQYLSPLTFIIAGIGPVVRIFQRIDDGNIQARLVHGNGVDLTWAPDGPGCSHGSIIVCSLAQAALAQASWRAQLRI
jgi:hypothetical protein